MSSTTLWPLSGSLTSAQGPIATVEKVSTNSDALLFFGTSGPRNARIAFVGECWGQEEARQTKPLVGESGRREAEMVRAFEDVPRTTDRVIFFPRAAGGAG